MLNKECKYCIKLSKECRRCQYARYKSQDLVKVCYQNLKYNSKRRGKEFDLSLEQFREFCIKTDYIQRRGTAKHSYHIDRIDETKGYTIDNIQVLTNSENVQKYISFLNRDEFGNVTFTTKINRPSKPSDDVPF